jgi:hypothetical protein
MITLNFFVGTRTAMEVNQDNPKRRKTIMKNSIKTSGIRIKSTVKAGGFGSQNHNLSPKTSGIRVKSTVKAGGFGSQNHNLSAIRR